MLGEVCGFVADRQHLLLQRRLAPFHFGALFAQTRSQCFRRGKPLIDCCQSGARRSQFVLVRLNRPAENNQIFRQPRAFRFCFRAAQCRRSVLVLGAFRALPCVLRSFPYAPQLVLADG